MSSHFYQREEPIDLEKIAVALHDIDSHGIYPQSALKPLAKLGVDLDKIPHFTDAETEARIIARGLGGYVAPTDEPLYYGWDISEGCVRQLGHEPEGNRYFGRGKAHTANIAQIFRLAKEAKD